METTEVDPAWEVGPRRSPLRLGRWVVGMLLIVVAVAWSVASPTTDLPTADPDELAVETLPPRPPPIRHVSFLGNNMAVDDGSADPLATHVAVQWGGGAIAVPFEPERAVPPPPAGEVFYECDGNPVRISSEVADLPTVVLIAGAGVHSQLMGCRPTVPDVVIDSTGLASWALPMLMRLDRSGLVADLTTGSEGELALSLRGAVAEPWAFTLLPAFGMTSRPPVGSQYVDLAGGGALRWEDTHYLHCDRASLVESTEGARALAAHLELIGCTPAAPARPRDPMDALLTATQGLAESLRDGGVPVADVEPNRPAVRFTVIGPAGAVQMLSMNHMTLERAGDEVIEVPEGAVLRRRDLGTVAACDGVLLAIDPEYQPVAVPTLQAMAIAAGCVLQPPAATP